MFIKLSYTQLQYRRKGTTGVTSLPFNMGCSHRPLVSPDGGTKKYVL